jgi:hypothetical protein
MSAEPPFEQEETDAAASEAALIGGLTGEEDLEPAERAVIEGGGGEAEGFEQAELALIEHSSHGDQQSAHAILHHQGAPEEYNATRQDADADAERSSELGEDS